MTLEELNKSKITHLPKTYKTYFPDFIKEIFTNYITELQTISATNGLYSREYNMIQNKIPYIKSLSKNIHKSIEEYYKGNVIKCYNKLYKIIKQEEPLFRKLITDPKDKDVINRLHPRGLFRLRKVKNGITNLERKDLFHIPFEYRHYATTARYSIPGLPCLYLSSSLYIAKKELNLHNTNKVYASRYVPSQNYNMSILDFGYQPKLLSNLRFQFFDEVIFPRVIFWPLIAACSIAVKDKDAVFKPEYIVPQFLFQIASNKFNFQGIRYFSTKVGYERPVNINYAIRVSNIDKCGYCSWLKDQFELTEPILWDRLNKKRKQTNTALITNEVCKVKIKNKLVCYKKTEYDKLERKIELFKTQTI